MTEKVVTTENRQNIQPQTTKSQFAQLLMSRFRRRPLAIVCVAGILFLSVLILRPPLVYAQTETATISGVVTDEGGGLVPNCEVVLQSVERGTATTGRTNDAGIYVFPNVQPGQYNLTVKRNGFKQVDFLGLIVNVQDHIEQNFRLQVGSVSESVTVEANQLNINTTDASVSTIVDRQFVENMPLNGRSFQSLIYLTPGVTLNVGVGQQSGFASGQFSVNGQRASSNYWMVDGVSANIGIGPWGTIGGGGSGSLGAFNVAGGTGSLVSVDALQEFRIETSTYAPEFGRTPGGQVSIVTRSGTNSFHGVAFDYLRNSAFDATDWFANANGLPKAQERQNDFGGTVGGPIAKDKLFFFFSYEGLRLHQPQTELTMVPDPSSRQAALSAMQPLLNVFPLPNPGKPDVAPGLAPFDASFTNPNSLNAYSLRIDYSPQNSLTLFGRYNYSPSSASQRGPFSTSLNTVSSVGLTTHTGTVGLTWAKSAATVNDLRFNYSQSGGGVTVTTDTFGGGVPLPSLSSLLPNGFTAKTAEVGFQILSGTSTFWVVGNNSGGTQHQYNLIDTFSTQRGAHGLKAGLDFRRLTPFLFETPYLQQPFFSTVADAETGNAGSLFQASGQSVTFLFRNLGIFAQDTWKISPRLTFTYGVRWDIDFSPQTVEGPSIPAVAGFSLTDYSHLALTAAGTPAYATRYGNFAPRVGLAYQVSQSRNWGRVLRAGFGVFYDLAGSEVGNQPALEYPFLISTFVGPATFPLNSPAPPPIIPPSPTQGTLTAFDPNLNLPYTLEWNVAIEQALGSTQTFTTSYIGSAGHRLLTTASITNPNANYASANLFANGATSNYNALQLQYQRRLSRGLQALASYTWSHSIDDGSYGAYTNGSIANLSANKGDSDFDIRNTFSLALTYDVPTPKMNAFMRAILGGWSTQNVIQVHSAPPVELIDGLFTTLAKENSSIFVRPDVVLGQPLYLYGPQYPGGKSLNPNAFTNPPVTPDGCVPGVDFPCNPTRQGNLGRNAVRAFGLTQWDFAVHRDFPIRESLKLQFRAEMFNVANHPNFAPFDRNFGTDPLFGRSTAMLGQYLTGTGATGEGAFSALYNFGGPRSVQLALKLVF